MAKYFCGVTINGDKYYISIIDDNLNIIFMDNLELDKTIDLLKRKSVTTISIDSPLALYVKNNSNTDKLILRKRSFDNLLSTKNLFTYNDRFTLNRNSLKLLSELSGNLYKLGFTIKKPLDAEKAIIESYPDTSFAVLGITGSGKADEDDMVRKRTDILKNKGMRMKNMFKKNIKDTLIEVNTLCQAYVAYLYHSGECTCLGTIDEGILVIPAKDFQSKAKPVKELRNGNVTDINQRENKHTPTLPKPERNINPMNTGSSINRFKINNKVIAEYCGAQYLYTNTDGIIRVNDLRPIKSYRPFTEIYEIKHIKQVQVVIGTTDGLRRVKANLIPNFENTNSFKAAEEEDKKKLDSFWGNNGDKRGYLIKFNKVEVIKA